MAFCTRALPGRSSTSHLIGTTLVLIVRTLALFILTALAEIVGCYLPYLWLRKAGSPWLLLPAAASLAIFSWLLTLHPTASGRVYAAYGGVYIAVALVWLWKVDRAPLTRWDIAGASVAVAGMAIIVWGGWRT
jgi:small multidrug resistance family-3 protein